MNTRELHSTLMQLVKTAAPNTEHPVVNIIKEYILNSLFSLLESFPDKTLTADCIETQTLRHFLDQVWIMIRGNHLLERRYSHCHYPANTYTIVCLALAQLLEPILKISRYQILMPTLRVIDYEISGTSLAGSELELHSFVLNDRNDSIIEVATCLDFAINDGVLKHTSLVDGNVVSLSVNEKSSVLGHSHEAREYWDAICKKIEIETKGESFGSALTRLANQLQLGGVNGGGGEGYELRLRYSTIPCERDVRPNILYLYLANDNVECAVINPSGNLQRTVISQQLAEHAEAIKILLSNSKEERQLSNKQKAVVFKATGYIERIKGEEYKSGKAANEGIADFANWLGLLEEDEWQELLSYTVTGKKCEVVFLKEKPLDSDISDKFLFIYLEDNNPMYATKTSLGIVRDYIQKSATQIEKDLAIKLQEKFKSGLPFALEYHTKHMLLALTLKRKHTGIESLYHLWMRLASPASEEHQDITYCVEIIAAKIESLLQNNPRLFDIYPRNAQIKSTIGLEKAKEKLVEKCNALKKAMSSPTCVTIAAFGHDNYVLTSLFATRDVRTHLRSEKNIQELERRYIQVFHDDLDDLKLRHFLTCTVHFLLGMNKNKILELFKGLVVQNKFYLITSILLVRFNFEFHELFDFINYSLQIESGLAYKGLEHDITFNNLIFKKYIHTLDDLLNFISYLNPQERFTFVNSIIDIMIIVTNGKELARLLEKLAVRDWVFLKKYVLPATITLEALTHLAEFKRKYFITCLGSESLDLLKNHHVLVDASYFHPGDNQVSLLDTSVNLYRFNNEDGYRALCRVVMQGSIEDVKTLLLGGILPDLYNPPGQIQESAVSTPLGIAAEFGKDEIAKLLLEAGAKVDEPSQSNMNGIGPMSPLSLALTHLVKREPNPKLIKYLLEYGADIDKIDNRYFITGLSRACAEEVYLILKAGYNPNRKFLGEFCLAWSFDNPAVFALLAENGADIHSINPIGDSYLHKAARDRDIPVSILKYLLMKGINVNLKNKEGKTPLDGTNDKEKRNLLIQYGAVTSTCSLARESLDPHDQIISNSCHSSLLPVTWIKRGSFLTTHSIMGSKLYRHVIYSSIDSLVISKLDLLGYRDGSFQLIITPRDNKQFNTLFYKFSHDSSCDASMINHMSHQIRWISKDPNRIANAIQEVLEVEVSLAEKRIELLSSLHANRYTTASIKGWSVKGDFIADKCGALEDRDTYGIHRYVRYKNKSFNRDIQVIDLKEDLSGHFVLEVYVERNTVKHHLLKICLIHANLSELIAPEDSLPTVKLVFAKDASETPLEELLVVLAKFCNTDELAEHIRQNIINARKINIRDQSNLVKISRI